MAAAATATTTRMYAGCVEIANYHAQREGWPQYGRHLMAQYTSDAVLVYQAFRAEIADHAIAHGRFADAPGWNATRMTWIKTSFLWMAYRSGWATKHGQERVVGVWLRRAAFERILSHAREAGGEHRAGTNDLRELVRLQWDPAHAPGGAKAPANGRRDIQLGLKRVRTYAGGEDIVRVVDMTPFMAEQRVHVGADEGALETPLERPYPLGASLRAVLGMPASEQDDAAATTAAILQQRRKKKVT